MSPAALEAQTAESRVVAKDYFDGRPNVQTGDKFDVRYFVRTKIAQNLPVAIAEDETIQWDNSSTSVIIKVAGDYEITAFDASRGGKARLTFSNLNATAQTPEIAPAQLAARNRQFNQLLGAISGATLEMSFDASGKVTKISGVEALQNRLIRAFPTNMPATLKAQFKAQLDEALSEKSLRESLQIGNAALPPQPVRVGESWPYQIKDSSGLAMRGSFKLVSLQNGVATLRESSNLSLVDKTEGVTSQFRGVQNGTLRFDNQSGQMREYTLLQRLTGQIPLEDFGPNIKIPMWISNEIRVVMEPTE